MAVIHRIVRREFRLLPPLVRDVPDGDTQRSEVVGSWAWEVLDFLHHHHEGEDTHLWPVLKLRLAGDPEAEALVARMEGQHDDLAESLNTATDLVRRWRASAGAADRELAAAAIEVLHEPTLAHLDEEEGQLCPLAQQHLTQHEWLALSRHGQRSTPRKQGAYILGALLEEASPQERDDFLGHLPVPIRWVARPLFEAPYQRRMAAVRRSVPSA